MKLFTSILLKFKEFLTISCNQNTSYNNSHYKNEVGYILFPILKGQPFYSQLIGAFYRSTLPIEEKFQIMSAFLTQGNFEELPLLIDIFENAYDVTFIPKRDEDWKEWYDT